MFVLPRLAAILICFAVTAIAGDASASIFLPKVVIDSSANDALRASGESAATSESTSDSQDAGPSASLPPIDEFPR